MVVPQRQKQARHPVHGVLLLDKPLGRSSNDALLKAKWLLRAEKAGHTGTLDPLATGLLPLCFGAATKFSQTSLDADKAYRATLALGRRSTTGDLEGELLEARPVSLDRAAIDAVLARFTGPISQLPPMHSALKKDGRPLYDFARAGIAVDRTPRQVTIQSIDLVDWQGDRLEIDVRCSKGTYIRTLAEDIGEALGCGAYLSGLRRTACGPLTLAGAVTLAELEALEPAARTALLRPVDCMLADWPALTLDAENAQRFLSGLRRRVTLPDAPLLRVYGPAAGALLGSALIRGGELIAERLLSAQEAAAVGAPAAPPCASATAGHAGFETAAPRPARVWPSAAATDS